MFSLSFSWFILFAHILYYFTVIAKFMLLFVYCTDDDKNGLLKYKIMYLKF